MSELLDWIRERLPSVPQELIERATLEELQEAAGLTLLKSGHLASVPSREAGGFFARRTLVENYGLELIEPCDAFLPMYRACVREGTAALSTDGKRVVARLQTVRVETISTWATQAYKAKLVRFGGYAGAPSSVRVYDPHLGKMPPEQTGLWSVQYAEQALKSGDYALPVVVLAPDHATNLAAYRTDAEGMARLALATKSEQGFRAYVRTMRVLLAYEKRYCELFGQPVVGIGEGLQEKLSLRLALRKLNGESL